MTKTHSYLHLAGNFLVLCRSSSALRNFPTFFALDCAKLLDVLRDRLKFHIDTDQGFKKAPKLVFRFTLLLSHHHIHFFVSSMQVCLGYDFVFEIG